MIHQNTQPTLTLPYLRLVTGLVLLGISLAAQIGFLGQGATGFTWLTIVLFVIAIDIIKCLFAGDVSYYSSLKQMDKALFSIVILGILFCLSVFAEVWLLSIGSVKNESQLSTQTARIEQLQQQVNDKQSTIATCTAKGMISKCATPESKALTELQSQLTAAMTAQSANNEAIANRKFYEKVSAALGTSADNLELGQNLLRSVISELMGLWLMGQFAGYKRLQSHYNAHLHQSHANILPESNQSDNTDLLAKIAQLEAELERKRELEKKP